MSVKQFSESLQTDPAKGESWCTVEASYYGPGIGTVYIITDEYEGVAILQPSVARQLLKALPRAIAFAEGKPPSPRERMRARAKGEAA